MVQDVTHKLCEAMSTTANIGLNQADYIMINRTESSTSSISSEIANSIRNQPPGGEVTSDVVTMATPSLESVSRNDASQQQAEEANDGDEHRSNHKSGSVENGQTADVATPHDHVSGVSKDVVKGEAPGAPSSSRETGEAAGAELQLPAKQALAVLSNVSKIRYNSTPQFLFLREVVENRTSCTSQSYLIYTLQACPPEINPSL